MNWTVVLLCLSLLAGALPTEAVPARFDNFQIVDVAVENEDQLTVLKSLLSDSEFTFLDQPAKIGQNVDLIVSPAGQQTLETLSLTHSVLVPNLQTLIDREQVVMSSRDDSEYNLEQFHRIDAMYEWLDSLPVTYPEIVTRIKGGDTYEGRTIEGVKLNKNPSVSKPAIFIEANIHAREWITSASTNWIVNELLTSTNPEVQALLDNYTWYVFPVANPDGYEYTHTNYRLWRKTRSRTGLICYGTDPNRNWDFEWEEGGIGASNDPCSDTFAGTAPFSEIETKTLSDFALSLKGEIKAYIAFHSAARMILSPYGHTNQVPEDHDKQMEIMTATYQRLNAVHGTVYTFGNTFDTIYATTGTSSDWGYGVLGAKIGYTYEFRDRGSDGQVYSFVAPPTEIKPNAEEVLQSLIGLTTKATELGYFN